MNVIPKVENTHLSQFKIWNAEWKRETGEGKRSKRHWAAFIRRSPGRSCKKRTNKKNIVLMDSYTFWWCQIESGPFSLGALCVLRSYGHSFASAAPVTHSEMWLSLLFFLFYTFFWLLLLALLNRWPWYGRGCRLLNIEPWTQYIYYIRLCGKRKINCRKNTY